MTASPAERRTAARSGLPALWVGKRRHYLSLLVLAGLGQAVTAGLSARFFSHALARGGAGTHGFLFAALVMAAGIVGLLRMAERILSERLSQDYVHEIRVGLIRRNLQDGAVKSLGIAVTRSTNDLTSVKNWVSQGVAPLAVGIPLIAGTGVALFLLDPLLTVGLAIPLALLFVALRTMAPVAYRRSRTVRRQRGRLSVRVADLIMATPAIRSAGGSARELSRVEKQSQSLVDASIERAQIAGAIRGAAAATTGIATATVIGTGLLAGLPTAVLAGALTLVGFLAAPLNDLGRSVEFRQSYRAARRIIGPAMQRPDSAIDARPSSFGLPHDAREGVTAISLRLADGVMMADLVARSGERIVVDAGSPLLTSAVLEQFAGLRPVPPATITVSGRDVSETPPKELRALVGYGARGMRLVTGSVSRTVRYRSPGTSLDDVERALGSVGLADRVARLDRGADTVLVRGGEPLSIPERARLILARALLADPPLVVLDQLDADLDADGRATLRRLLAAYPGIVLVASEDPEQIIAPTRRWHVQAAAVEPSGISADDGSR